MRFNILIGGKAGQGIQELAVLIGKVLVNEGFYVFNYRDYGSLIAGGHNFNTLCISDKPVHSQDDELDVLVALDENTIKKHKGSLKKQGIFVSDSYININKILEKHKLDIKVANMIYAGFLWKTLGLDSRTFIEEIREEFKSKPQLLEQDIKAFEQGYLLAENKKLLQIVKKGEQVQANLKTVKQVQANLKTTRYFMIGSEGIAIGALASGLDVYLAYPMTPATPVQHILASGEIENNILVFQPENEITVANAGLGASYAGAKVMIGSSGGGFDLMTEALSFQGMSEIPLVTYLSQRPGPGTGVPTYSLQGDLKMALGCGHGEFSRVVVAPGDPLECIEKTNEAFYLSYKLGVVSIIMADKHLGESHYTFSEMPRIKAIEDNRKLPGKQVVKISSYEHNDKGLTIEHAEDVIKKFEYRIEKAKKVNEEVEKLETFKVFGNKKAGKTIVAWGSTKGAILDSLENLNDFKFLQILYIEPFSEKLKKELLASGELFVLEQNSTGQLADVIEGKIFKQIDKKHRILKYDTLPFTKKEIEERLR